MTQPQTTTRYAIEKAQLIMTFGLILGAIIYVGRRLERMETK
jgi:hypothetical protein